MVKRTVGNIADDILKIKRQEKKHRDVLEILEKDRGDLEAELRKAADEQGLDKGGGKKSTFTIDEKTVPVIQDWDKFCEYIAEQNYFHLLQKRAGEKACQELWELGRIIPGVNKFTFVKVNVKEVK